MSVMANLTLQQALQAAPASATLADLKLLREWLTAVADERTENVRLEFARNITAAVVRKYWQLCCAAVGENLSIRPAPVTFNELAAGQHLRFAECCASLPPVRAFYEIGELHTALLPADFRTRHGIYYTPPELVAHLLDLVTAEGTDWSTARVLDPACGGAAFLAYLAERMLSHTRHLPAGQRLDDLEARLVGFEIDPFSAWLSAVLVDVVALPVITAAGRRLAPLIRTADTLAANPAEIGSFDLVIGNPPYGKIRLDGVTREKFGRSLYGHANLYGLFTDTAVRLCRPGGLIGFVTPTSFLGGEYFKNLRKFLKTEAPLIGASFIRDREGMFSDVLQETMLATFRRSTPKSKRTATSAAVELIHPLETGTLHAESAGTYKLGTNEEEPWLLPRARSQVKLVKSLNRMNTRLADYGYRVATGQLVWNRHKPQLRSGAGRNCFPIIWAEAIQPDGSFSFRAENRNHLPFLQVEDGQDFLLNFEPCVLVQRTTSKEQARRLVAAAIPNDFIVEHPGFVVENHVNMIVPTVASPSVSLGALARLLNCGVVDEAFRCISGSVAVSAFELESLPLPEPAALLTAIGKRWARLSAATFEAAVESLYHEP